MAATRKAVLADLKANMTLEDVKKIVLVIAALGLLLGAGGAVVLFAFAAAGAAVAASIVVLVFILLYAVAVDETIKEKANSIELSKYVEKQVELRRLALEIKDALNMRSLLSNEKMPHTFAVYAEFEEAVLLELARIAFSREILDKKLKLEAVATLILDTGSKVFYKANAARAKAQA